MKKTNKIITLSIAALMSVSMIACQGKEEKKEVKKTSISSSTVKETTKESKKETKKETKKSTSKETTAKKEEKAQPQETKLNLPFSVEKVFQMMSSTNSVKVSKSNDVALKKKETSKKSATSTTEEKNTTPSVNSYNTGNSYTPSYGDNNSYTPKPTVTASPKPVQKPTPTTTVYNPPKPAPTTTVAPKPAPTTTVADEGTWEPVYKTVWIEPKGHVIEVVDKEAWVEELEEPEYAMRWVCQIVSTGELFYDDGITCVKKAAGMIRTGEGNGQTRGWQEKYQVGTKIVKIEHPAETHEEWVLDEPGREERVIDYYKNTKTGEIRKP